MGNAARVAFHVGVASHWPRDPLQRDAPLSNTVLANMKSFVGFSQLKQSALDVISFGTCLGNVPSLPSNVSVCDLFCPPWLGGLECLGVGARPQQ